MNDRVTISFLQLFQMFSTQEWEHWEPVSRDADARAIRIVFDELKAFQ